MSAANLTCPQCGSNNIAEILWGMPAFDDALQKDLDEGRIVLGGCCVTGDNPKYHCNDCEYDFGLSPMAEFMAGQQRSQQLKAIVYGAAVGDALGVPYEFKARDTFECKGMVGGGSHNVPKGTFSDDTSMMLATCDSIRECGCIDIDDMRKRFCDWLYKGAYTVDGSAFDYGNTTAAALSEGKGCTHERSNGNGSLMRIAPLALTNATDDEIKAVSAITHAHPISTEACVSFVYILREVLAGNLLEEAISANIPDDSHFEFMHHIQDWTRDDVHSGGYVIDTFGAALWCALKTDSYADCVLTAVNLGEDTDTTACVAGALAGAMYGYDAIYKSWIKQLRSKDIIDASLFI